MIIPTARFDPLFADDGVPFRTKMLGYIQREFADMLEQDLGSVRRVDEFEASSDTPLVRLHRQIALDSRPAVLNPKISVRAAS